MDKECRMTAAYYVLTDLVGGQCSLALLTIKTNTNLTKSVFTKMSGMEDVLFLSLAVHFTAG